MYPTMSTVRYFDEFDNAEVVETFYFYSTTFEEAARIVGDYVGDSVISSMTITMGEAGSLWRSKGEPNKDMVEGAFI